MKNKFFPVIFFIFTFLFFLNFTLTAQELGDANLDGSIDIIDSLIVAQYYVGIITTMPLEFYKNSDVNLDGSISIVDALLIAQYYAGLIPTLPPTSSSPLPTESPSPSTPPSSEHLDNPFEEAVWYRDPLWSNKAIEGGGEVISMHNTAIWLDRIGAITEGIGLRGHLNNALSQSAKLITFVLYNMPNRDCFNSTENSNLWFNKDGAFIYKTEFIDPITAIFSDPAYRDLRIIIIIEPKSLVSSIFSYMTSSCKDAIESGGYIDCSQYVLNRFCEVPNVYSYMDFANASWLGWETNMYPAIDLFTSVIERTEKGLDSVDGFALNTAHYDPVEEPFLPDSNVMIGDKALRSCIFYEYNFYFDEMSFAQDLYNNFVAKGFSEDIGIIIDTSHNGWGGPKRPTEVSLSTDLESYVNESRIDKRQHRGNYCNIAGGIGYRPQANPAPHIDAYVWAWPPGYSRGISSPEAGINPYHPNTRYDPMCNPKETSIYNSEFGTDAIGNAPFRFQWYQENFELLLQNAYPPIE